jgi:spermidine/putrescine ABC transporter ATP-binding subunit
MSRVLLRQVSKVFAGSTAVHPTTLDVPEGQFLTLLGPSGCGKTTTLRMIAGFVEPTAGQILIDDEDVTQLPPQRRRIGMVFQDYALFPHMTIADNIGFGLRERRQSKAQIHTRVAELLDLIRLPEIANRYPAQISGGQAQRVALARAIAYPPRVLLMDEPLGALDLKLRETMQFELRRIQRALGITTVFVTHDQTEAMNLSDVIAVMGGGRVVQMGTPQEVYDQPRTRFVADFIGQINLLDGAVVDRDGALAVIEIGGTRVRMQAASQVSGRVSVGIRPQHLMFSGNGADTAGANVLHGAIRGRTFSGNLMHVEVELDGGQSVTVETSPDAKIAAPGARVALAWHADRGTVLTQ